MRSMTHSYIFVLIPSYHENIIFCLIQSVSVAKDLFGIRRFPRSHRLTVVVAGVVGAAIVDAQNDLQYTLLHNSFIILVDTRCK